MKSESQGTQSRDGEAVVELIPDLGAEELDQRIRNADRRSEIGARELAFYLAEMQERGMHQLLGYPSAAEYACRRLEMSRRHAQELIAVGRALAEMPAIDEAFCEGRLRWSRVRLLARIAVPETEDAWLERALALPWRKFDRLVATSQKGRAPRDDGKGTPKPRVVVRGRLGVLAYETWELAKQKLSDERGERMTDADCIAYAGTLILGTRKGGGPVEAREAIDDSIYKVVIQKCPDCDAARVRTVEGEEEIDARAAARVSCDAPSVAMDDDGHHEEKTPPWVRRKVLDRDGRACVICRGRREMMVHHVVWLSRGGKTKAENLISLCATCHGRVHEGLSIMTGTAPHGLTITDRHGVPLDQAAPIAKEGVVRMRSAAGPLPAEAGGPDGGAPLQPTEAPNAHRPPRLAEVIGQERTVRALTVAAKAAKKRGAPVDHVLLLGGAGLGKTTLAEALAAEIGTRFHVASGPMVQEPEVLVGLLRKLADQDVLFIDEIHALPRRSMECLYEAMEDRRISLTAGDGAEAATLRLPLARFTLVGATTEVGLLPEPFVSRFPIREHLVSYAEADLAAIVARAAARDGVPIDDDAAPELAARATIDRGLVSQALEAAGYDEDGLLPIEQQALDVLRRHGRPMGLARWAASAGLPPASIRTLCEPELLRQGLITVTPRGRLARAQLRAVARDAARGGGRGTYATLPPLFATG